MRGAASNGVDHSGETLEFGELQGCGARALDGDDEGEAEGVNVFVHVDGLGDAVVFDDELLGLEAVEHVAVSGLDGGGDEDDVGLHGEGLGGVGRSDGRGRLRVRDGGDG